MKACSLIRSLLGAENLTAKDLAVTTKLTSATLSRYLNGKTDIKSESFIKILDAFNIDLHDLLQKSLFKKIKEESASSLVTEDLSLVFCSLDELDQKTLLNSMVSALPSRTSSQISLAAKNLTSYASGLGLRKRQA